MFLQEELSTGAWLNGECLLLHSVLVCLDEDEELLRSVGLAEELDRFSSFSFEVCNLQILWSIVNPMHLCIFTHTHTHTQ